MSSEGGDAYPFETPPRASGPGAQPPVLPAKSEGGPEAVAVAVAPSESAHADSPRARSPGSASSPFSPSPKHSLPRIAEAAAPTAPPEASGEEGGEEGGEAKADARRAIRIAEDPALLPAEVKSPSSTVASSRPAVYYMPPRASGRSELGVPRLSHKGERQFIRSSSGGGREAGGSSSPPVKGIVKGIARMVMGPRCSGEYNRESFSAESLSPDARRLEEERKGAVRRAGRTYDLYSEENVARWRMQCLTRASERDLSHARDAKVLYKSRATDNFNDPLVIAVGAHYSKRVISRDDMLLYAVQQLEKLRSSPYTIVYFHSNVTLPKIPAVGFFKSLVSAMGASKRNLKAIYVVHPTVGLKAWMLALQVRVDSGIFSRVVYLNKASDLKKYFSSPSLWQDVPPHVTDVDERPPQAAS